MNLLVVGLILSLTLAVTASVFAIWPVVADAPWESNTEIIVTESSNDVRCEAALDLREMLITQGELSRGNPAGVRDYDLQLIKAVIEIDQLC